LKAALLYGPRDLRIEEIKEPGAPRGWALMKTIAVGICGTDKAFYTGTYKLFKRPLVPGHEVVGEVVKPFRLQGKLVVPEINFSCWKCEVCREGLYIHCPYKRTLGIDFDGGMAEYFVAPLSALHEVDLDPLTAVAVEPLAAVINALNQFPLSPNASVAVLGSGNLALLALQLLKFMGFKPVAVIRRGSKKRKNVEGLGVDVVELEDVEEYLKRRTSLGLGFHAVFEATGSSEGLDIAIKLVRPRGLVYLKSTPGSPFVVDMTNGVVKEVRVIGSRCGTCRDFEKAIELLESGVVNPIVTRVMKGLDSAKKAFECAIEPEEVKVVVKTME
jgi:alcohol dehydrogenase